MTSPLLDGVGVPDGVPEAEREQLARHGVVYLAARVAQIAAYVAVLPVITRLLGSEQYGTVALTLVVHQVLAAIAGLGLPSIVAFPIFDRLSDGIDRSTRLVVAITLCSLGVVAAAHLTGPWWVGLFAGLEYEAPVILAVWMVVPVVTQSACLSILQARGRPVAFALSVVVATVGGQALGLGLLAVRPSAAAYWTGLFLGAVAGAAIAALAVPIRVRRPAGVHTVLAGIRHGGPAVPHLLAFMVLAAADRVLVDRYLGITEAARYQVAYLVGASGFAVLRALNNAWSPAVFGATESRRWPLLARTTVQIGALMTALLTIVALLAPILLRLAAPPAYRPEELAPVVTIVVAALVFDVMYLSGAHVLFRARRTGALLLIMPVAAVVNILLNIVLIPRFDLVGAAVATLVGYALAGVGARLSAARVASVPWERGRELVLLGATVLATTVALALPTHGIGLGVRVLLAALVGLAVGLVLLRMRRDPTGAFATA